VDPPRLCTIVGVTDRELLRAPAKLTLTLRVTGVRDDGMHEIDAEMVTLDLFDDLWVRRASTTVSLDPDGRQFDFDPADNLITRAANLARVEADVVLHKRIPAGAGLGGGSSNAAALLRWAGFTDVERAATIGADVAFCLVGGRARVRGIGEVVERLDYVRKAVTLVTPPVHCSTPAVYAAWDRLGGPNGDNGNDLEPAALHVAPQLAESRDALGNATGKTPRLAGSGSSWFVEGDFPEAGSVFWTLEPDLKVGSGDSVR